MANTINAAKTHCDSGHEFTEENTGRNKDGHRFCRSCANGRTRIRMARIREQKRAAKNRAESKRILGLPERFWAKVAIKESGYPTPCLIWVGTLSSKGYGVLGQRKQQFYAHRVAYEAWYGEIPKDRTPRPVLDHLCRNPSCVNADHLDLVTDRVNVLRGESFAAVNFLKTHCAHGHEFSPENTRIDGRTGERVCRECKRIRGRVYDARRRKARRDRKNAS